MSNLDKVEQIKLLANALNNLAVAVVSAGILGPAVALIYDFQKVTTETTLLWSLPVVCFCGAVILHLGGQFILMNLRKIDEGRNSGS
ncbi:hypothetical protein ACJMQP_13660 [Rhodopseudomonas palustris]